MLQMKMLIYCRMLHIMELQEKFSQTVRFFEFCNVFLYYESI